MTLEEQRIAIAEVCGWKREPLYDDIPAGRNAWRHNDMRVVFTKNLPDYLNDLNAMHEAEKTLKEPEKTIYLNNLSEIGDCEWNQVHATAEQRAKAFLKAINKWK